MRRFERFACIDWSGAAGAFQPGIAVAVCEMEGPPALVQPPARCWSREAVLGWLLRQRDIFIGFDFSASLPFADAGAFFPNWCDSPPDARALWSLIDKLADEPHFGVSRLVDHDELARHFRRHGGRTGDLFKGSSGRLRVTEQATKAAGFMPTSSFNLVGAAQVGKASLAGMRLLHRLDGRTSFWPFDPLPECGPCIVEVYTTIAARAAGVARGRSKMRDGDTLDEALAVLGSPPHSRLARYDDHRTDALLGAAWLRHVASDERLWHPPALTPDIARTEGWTFGVS